MDKYCKYKNVLQSTQHLDIAFSRDPKIYFQKKKNGRGKTFAVMQNILSRIRGGWVRVGIHGVQTELTILREEKRVLQIIHIYR